MNDLLTVGEAAAVLVGALDISWMAAWKLVREGKVKSVQIGRSRRVPMSALQDYLNRLMEEAA